MHRFALAAALVLAAGSSMACSIYDDSLLAPNGAGGAGASGPGTSSAGGGSTVSTSSSTGGGTSSSGAGGGCASPADCPGSDTDCHARTCQGGTCGVDFTPANTALAMQTPGDCQSAVCDGSGGVTSIASDADVPVDGKACTDDVCTSGVPSNPPLGSGVACNEGGGKLCNGAGICVECLADGDCLSQVCDLGTNKCLAAMCNDKVKNGTETDVDCGGGGCSACATGQSCTMGSDCLGGICMAGKCAASCSDGMINNTETDVDCGGGGCPACDIGKTCVQNADCASNLCTMAQCVCNGDHLVISEIRTRGAASAADEFVEIYNPTAAALPLDASWKIEARSHNGANYVTKWTGAGTPLPAHGHYLVVGTGYTEMPAGDATLSNGVTDAGSVRLVQTINAVSTVIDAVCFSYSASTLAAITGDATFSCEGTPVSNLPHNDTTGGTSNSDASIERKPGGPDGNCIDTKDSSADFRNITPAMPQNRFSAVTP